MGCMRGGPHPQPLKVHIWEGLRDTEARGRHRAGIWIWCQARPTPAIPPLPSWVPWLGRPGPNPGAGPQMAYQAWVTNAQTVLRRQQQEQARQEQAGQLPTGELGGVETLRGSCRTPSH